MSRQNAILAGFGMVALLLTSGCSRQHLIGWFASAQDRATAEHYINDLRERDLGSMTVLQLW